MKYFFILLFLISGVCYGQTTYYIQADSVRFRKIGANSDFILENSTRARTGAYLKNRWNGRTEFGYAVDSGSVSGSDLILWRGNGTQNITIPGIGTSYTFTNGLTESPAGTVKLGGSLTGNTEIAQAGFSMSFTGGNVGINTSIPASKVHIKTDGIYVTQTDSTGLYLENSTAATSGLVRQYSPGIVWKGAAWKNTGSQTHLWRAFVEPINTTVGLPNSIWKMQSSQSGDAYFDIMKLHTGTGQVTNFQVFQYNSTSFGRINSVQMGLASGPYFGQAPPSGATGTFNTSIGLDVLTVLTSGSYNTGIGENVLSLNTSGGINTGVGYQALRNNITGGLNTAIGVNALLNNTADKNTAVGAGAMEANTTGNHNTAVGYDALFVNTTGVHNIGVGWNALGGNQTGSYNVGIGHRPGNSINGVGSDYNIFIGYDAGNNVSQLSTATKSIAIGYGSYTTASDQIVLGGTNITQTRLRGAIYFNDAAGTLGQVLTSAGTGGPPTWETGVAGSTPISSLTAATGTNTLAIGNLQQEWTANTLSGNDGGVFRISSNSTTVTNLDQLVGFHLTGANANDPVRTTTLSAQNGKTGTGSTNVAASFSSVNGVTNIGGQFQAIGGTNNYAIIVAANAGNVGIGTSTPTEKLEVVGGSIMGRWKARVGSTTSSATPTINTDNVDIYKLTAQAADITSFTTNLSGSPNDGDVLEIQITGTAARAITWGASFVSSTVTLPTTTVTTATLTVILQFYTTSSYGNSKWVCANYY